MFETIVESALALLLIVGLPALFIFFVLKGAFIGKPLPTTVILPGYVLAISASPLETAGIVAVSSAGYVCGQLIIYFGAQRGGLTFVRSAPRVHITDDQLRRGEALFEKYGGAGIFFTNFVPYVRGLILVPAGMASYPVVKVVFYAYTSTLIYHSVIVVLALGAVRAIF